MMNLIFVFCILFSYGFSFFYGTTEAVTAAVFSGAERAVTLVLSLLGMMCLWTGLLEVAQSAGLTKKVERLLSPLTNVLFPSLSDGSAAKSAIVMSMSANLLGLSNAATPLGLVAMEELKKRSLSENAASDEMCMFVVINTAAFSFMPTTLIALRAAAGSAAPFSIMVPVWICSFLSVLSGILAAKAFARRWKYD